jgi:hypothetical protein
VARQDRLDQPERGEGDRLADGQRHAASTAALAASTAGGTAPR